MFSKTDMWPQRTSEAKSTYEQRSSTLRNKAAVFLWAEPKLNSEWANEEEQVL